MAWRTLGLPRSIVASALVLVALTMPATALAQTSPPPAAIGIGAPPAAKLGEHVTLQARLVDDAGGPIAGATVFFTVPSTFLSARADVVIAQATTDSEGLAVAPYEIRATGKQIVSAEFPGNARQGSARASTPMDVAAGERQLYVEKAGAQIPGLNVPPQFEADVPASVSPSWLFSLLSTLWPRFSGWPIALALSVVWSLYVYVVVLIFRVTATDSGPIVLEPGARDEADTSGPSTNHHVYLNGPREPSR